MKSLKFYQNKTTIFRFSKYYFHNILRFPFTSVLMHYIFWYVYKMCLAILTSNNDIIFCIQLIFLYWAIVMSLIIRFYLNVRLQNYFENTPKVILIISILVWSSKPFSKQLPPNFKWNKMIDIKLSSIKRQA